MNDIDKLKLLAFDAYDMREKIRAKIIQMMREEESLSREILEKMQEISRLEEIKLRDESEKNK